MPLQPTQTILNNRYRIVRPLGEGGFARVWLAEDTVRRLEVAIKEPRSGLTGSQADELAARFARELRYSGALFTAEAPHTVRVITVEAWEDTPLLVMEYCGGGSLRDRLGRDGPRPAAEVVRLALDLLAALHIVHEKLGWVHRDLKPENVLFTADGRTRLADFGLAQTGDSGRSAGSGQYHPGTPAYMSPEQQSATGYLTPASDLYALGCVLFEALTGKLYRRARPGTRAGSLVAGVPAWLDDALAVALHEDPWSRYESAELMAAALGGMPAEADRQRIAAEKRATEEAVAAQISGQQGKRPAFDEALREQRGGQLPGGTVALVSSPSGRINTGAVLADAIANDGLQYIAAGANPVRLKRGIEKAVAAVCDAIKAQATTLTTREQLTGVATTCTGSPEIGQAVTDALEKVGRDGLVEVKDGPGVGLGIEYAEGMQIEGGYLSEYFVTDPDRMEARLTKPYILLVDTKLSSAADLATILNKLEQLGKRNIAVIAPDVEGAALAALVQNKLRGTFNCLAVKAPDLGNRSRAMLLDIAIDTGGFVITSELGRSIEDAMISDLGEADTIVSNRETTIIIGGRGDASHIKGRLERLQGELKTATNDAEVAELREEIARLAGAVATIRVGVKNDAERNEKKRQIEDALAASRAAIEDGFVPGGYAALLNAAEVLADLEDSLEGDVLTGVRLVRGALVAPLRALAENAGCDGATIIAEIQRLRKDRNNTHIGFDAVSETCADMIARNIIEPVGVVSATVQTAASAAITILTRERPTDPDRTTSAQ